MITAQVLLNNIESVNRFVAKMSEKDYDIDLSSGKYLVNGKSMMGVLSLDLTKPVKVIAHCDNSHSFVAFCEQYLYGEK